MDYGNHTDWHGMLFVLISFPYDVFKDIRVLFYTTTSWSFLTPACCGTLFGDVCVISCARKFLLWHRKPELLVQSDVVISREKVGGGKLLKR
jgi:hypothetical protein